MSKLSITDNDGVLSEGSYQKILDHTDILECACPRHLLKILDSIREFQEYETKCIIKYPKDQEIHSWLLESSKNLEKLATDTIVGLMKRESVIDENNYFCVPPKFSPST